MVLLMHTYQHGDFYTYFWWKYCNMFLFQFQYSHRILNISFYSWLVIFDGGAEKISAWLRSPSKNSLHTIIAEENVEAFLYSFFYWKVFIPKHTVIYKYELWQVNSQNDQCLISIMKLANICTQAHWDMFQLQLSWDATQMSYLLSSNKGSCPSLCYTVGKRCGKGTRSSRSTSSFMGRLAKAKC